MSGICLFHSSLFGPCETIAAAVQLSSHALTPHSVSDHSPWGEHEIDYVLFFCVQSKDELTIQPHPDEVDATKWVSRQGLIDMMQDKSLLFSPWFRLICKKWLLDSWWTDLSATMNTDKYCDFVNIHRFDPPKGTFPFQPQFRVDFYGFVFLIALDSFVYRTLGWKR